MEIQFPSTFSWPFANSIVCEGPERGCKCNVKSSSRRFRCHLKGFMWHTAYVSAWQKVPHYLSVLSGGKWRLHNISVRNGDWFLLGQQALWTPHRHWHTETDTSSLLAPYGAKPRGLTTSPTHAYAHSFPYTDIHNHAHTDRQTHLHTVYTTCAGW